jgi:polar amino acid transport system substrate-binding protein
MKKFRKSIIIGLVLALMLTMVTGCGAKPAEEEQAQVPVENARPLEGQELRYAINATFPPFESVEIVDGKTNFIGMDIEIVDYLSEQLGFTYEITDMAFAGLVGAIQSDRADFVCSGISPTAERLENVDFSVSYFYPGIAVVSRKDMILENLEELVGKKIVVGFGTTYEVWANKNVDSADVLAIDGTPAVIQELKNKRADAAILDANQAAEFVNQNPDLQFNVLEYDQSRENSFAIAFPKDSELTEIFNAELNKMIENGEMDKIVIKWCGEEFAQ